MDLKQKQLALKVIEEFIVQREEKMNKRKSITTAEYPISELTLTQLHIIALIKEHSSEANNTFLSIQLSISKPAVTKAVNQLMKKGLILSEKKEGNQKSVYYYLTQSGEQLASVHREIHRKVIERYEELLNKFTEDELSVIIRFMSEWTNQIKKTDLVE
ncbi:MarR family transcriptional regulator [Paenibacillus sp. D2_2]|uniref:MarR family transcriptional regulator n=1 Tax=Paenibacillus sp. D2_2 TaxID=3073092 RepID=UPI002815E1F3|nr:MarR family transcriptional regulator [Paenibacillus sp. D2_2]WMT40807.1 MarR family transcriptional regulator [Paenibacillus sp. D2_2]